MVKIRCIHCDKNTDRNDIHYSESQIFGSNRYEEGEPFCQVCYEDLFTMCCDCDHELPRNRIYRSEYSDGDVYCEDCYYERYTNCDVCDMEVERDDANYDEDYYYCDGCWEEREGREISLESYSSGASFVIKESETYDKNPFKRLASLEVETILGSDWGDVRDGCPPDWMMTTDGSLPEDGAEFLLKAPQNGDMLYESIDSLALHLRMNSCYPNTSCGLHVHIDARDLQWEELKGVLLVGKKVEKYLYKMIPASRMDSTWCRPLPMSVESILRIDSNESFIDTWYDSCSNSPSLDKYNSSRYHGMNMHARIYLGSIEFRYHSGTNNPRKMKNWLYLCQAIVETGIEVGRKLSWSKTDSKMMKLYTEADREITFTEFVVTLNLSDEVVDYVLKRIDKFTEPDESIVEFSSNAMQLTYP